MNSDKKIIDYPILETAILSPNYIDELTKLGFGNLIPKIDPAINNYKKYSLLEIRDKVAKGEAEVFIFKGRNIEEKFNTLDYIVEKFENAAKVNYEIINLNAILRELLQNGIEHGNNYNFSKEVKVYTFLGR